MKIIRHTARDMRQALRGVREQLGEDAVILSSRRTGDGVEVTAAVDFDASTLEAGGFADTPATVAPPPKAPPTKAPPAAASRALAPPPKIIDATPVPAATRAAPGIARPAGSLSATALALTSGRAGRTNKAEPTVTFQPLVPESAEEIAPEPAPAPSYDQLAALEHPDADFDPDADHNPGVDYNSGATYNRAVARNPGADHNSGADYDSGAAYNRSAAHNPGAPAYHPGYDADWISEAVENDRHY